MMSLLVLFVILAAPVLLVIVLWTLGDKNCHWLSRVYLPVEWVCCQATDVAVLSENI